MKLTLVYIAAMFAGALAAPTEQQESQLDKRAYSCGYPYTNPCSVSCKGGSSVLDCQNSYVCSLVLNHLSIEQAPFLDHCGLSSADNAIFVTLFSAETTSAYATADPIKRVPVDPLGL